MDYNEKDLRKLKKLSATTSQKYLYKLDRLDLIKLEKKNRIKPVMPKGPVGISPKLAQKVKYDIDNAFIKYAQKKSMKDKESTEVAPRGSFMLCDKSLRELKQEIDSLYDEFGKRTKREMILYKENELIKATMLTVLANGFETSNHMEIEKI